MNYLLKTFGNRLLAKLINMLIKKLLMNRYYENVVKIKKFFDLCLKIVGLSDY